MSVIRPKPPEDPIGYAAGGLVTADGAGGRAALEAALDRARRDVLDDEGCRQPERQLAAYNTGGGRRASDLFAILQAARHLRDAVDRVVIAGDDLGTLGGRAVFESCAHPRHNDLSRGDRGGRPRLLFAGSSLGNDGLQAILDTVTPGGGRPADDLLDAWGVLAVGSVDPDSFATASARLLLERLADGSGGAERLRERACVVAAEGSWLAERAAACDCAVRFGARPGLGAAAVFSPAGLLPAAIAGIDVVQLLAGAAAMHRRFREAPVAENPVLRHVAAVRAGAAAVGGGDVACRLVADVDQLAAVCGWHDRLEAVRRQGVEATADEPGPCPPEPVETRLVVRVMVDAPRREPLSLPGRPVCGAVGPVIRLPRVDEHAVGQLLQLLVVADRVLRRG
jgi:glucose-6-phosphate isomerase